MGNETQLQSLFYLEHEEAGKPPVLSFPYETVLDGRNFERPCNYFLVRIVPDADQETDPRKRPFVIFDPRAGHGPGIGGSKTDSQVGAALRAGHPCYFVGFYPEPVPGQTLATIAHAEARFLEKVTELHPEADGKPCIIGNCQAEWAIMVFPLCVLICQDRSSSRVPRSHTGPGSRG